mgnify:CR=1 FL=1
MNLVQTLSWLHGSPLLIIMLLSRRGKSDGKTLFYDSIQPSPFIPFSSIDSTWHAIGKKPLNVLQKRIKKVEPTTIDIEKPLERQLSKRNARLIPT